VGGHRWRDGRDSVPTLTVTRDCRCFPCYIPRTTPASQWDVPLLGSVVGRAPGDELITPYCMENSNNTPTPPPKHLSGLLDKQIDVRSLHADSYPSFFLMKRDEEDKLKTFKGVSPFKINNFMERYVGRTKSASRMRDGSLLLEVCSWEQAQKVASLKLFGTFPVSVEPHKTLNTSKGVIFCPDLVGIDENTILNELKAQRVIEIKNIMARKESELKPSPLHILTFNSVLLPENIFVGYLRVSVRPHIPNPIRCLRCQRFGHVQHTCERPHVCPNCSKSDEHGDKPCDREVKCLNCGGSHPAWSRDCPVWKKEKKITEIKIKDRLSIADARKKYNSLSPSLNLHKSFAQATAAKQTPSQEDVHPSQPSEFKDMMAMMALILAGQKDNKEKLEEQSKMIEEQTRKIDEQTNQISQLRKENENLRSRNQEMEEELVALKLPTKQTKTPIESCDDRSKKGPAKKLKRDQTNQEGGQPMAATSEDEMDVDSGSTDKPGRRQHSRVDFLKKS
jgi:hypothetical protein